MKAFFKAAEGIADLPVIKGELNFIFDGCYTTQTRIKNGNRVCENMLGDSEAMAGFAALKAGYGAYDGGAYMTAWTNVLFSHFHDIITGSGVTDTREYMLGKYAETLAVATSQKTKAMEAFMGRIDTSSISLPAEDSKDERALGAGPGYGINGFKVSQLSRGQGDTRLFNVFNMTQECREEVVELVIWNYIASQDLIEVRDAAGKPLTHQFEKHWKDNYWGHECSRIFVKVKVRPFGYTTLVVSKKAEVPERSYFGGDIRTFTEDDFTLENDLVKAVICPVDLSIAAFIDKATGENLIKDGQSAHFRHIIEDSKGMTSWTVGRYKKVTKIADTKNAKVLYGKGSPLRKGISYRLYFESSYMDVTVTLDDGSAKLRIGARCHWREIGTREGAVIPQLSFFVPVSYEVGRYLYDIPGGFIERVGCAMDNPGLSFAMAKRAGKAGKQLAIITTNKYGFRCHRNGMGLTLIRSSFDPDEYPEVGIHEFAFELAAFDAGASNGAVAAASTRLNVPLNVFSANGGKGDLPMEAGFMDVQGTARVTAVKMPEDGAKDALIVRLYEADGATGEAVLTFPGGVRSASLTDTTEKAAAGGDVSCDAAAGKVSVKLPASSVRTVRVTF